MNILLLEPNYKNKYPPLGLMKIATFHKQNNDDVIFSKDERNDLSKTKWDRIYINSLFTFEWPATKKMIDFAFKLTSDRSIIYLGGIAATLLPAEIKEQYPDINIVQGLLDTPGKLNLPNDGTIDTLPPDYTILDQISYKYPTNDAYFSYATRGCGMNCSFCAVQYLEPTYINYVPIKPQIENVIQHCGQKRNLMLMDNNVLKSPRLADIVQDIVDLGFAKGAKFRNKNGNLVKRHVDFNQGLDANFLTAEKAALLARLELNPVRIAFDHIQQKDKYVKAINTCFNAGLKSFSNYLLYNTDNASWKGQSYGADTPEDLYNRLKFNVELCEEFNQKLISQNSTEKAYIYSFPMRYIPLSDMRRGYIGDNWDKKALRAIQVFITPTQGKGVSSRSFFEASFGKDISEFKIALYTPENILVRRGDLKFTKAEEDDEAKKLAKIKKHTFNVNLRNEWDSIVKQLQGQNLWEHFINKYIKCNRFSFDVLDTIDNELEKKAYLFYITNSHYKNYYEKQSNALKQFITDYLNKDVPHLKEYLTTK